MKTLLVVRLEKVIGISQVAIHLGWSLVVFILHFMEVDSRYANPKKYTVPACFLPLLPPRVMLPTFNTGLS